MSVLQAYSQQSESYYVIHIRGKIRNATRNEELKSGVKIFADDKLIFTDNEATAVVMSTVKGRMILKKNAQANNSVNNLWSFVKNNLLPLPTTGRLSSRSTEESITNLKGYFSENQFMVIGNTIKLDLNPKNYPLGANRYVGIQYQVKNQSVSISKRLPSDKNAITIQADSLFSPDITIRSDSGISVRLFYMNPQKNSSAPVESLSLKMIFISENSLREQLTAILSSCQEKGIGKDAVLREFSDYIVEMYGKTDEKLFRQWVEKNIKF